MMQRQLVVVLLLCGFDGAFAGADDSRDAALVTAVGGQVSRFTQQGKLPLRAFSRLRRGDQLALASGARLQIVYIDGGRQEVWRGVGNAAGRIEVRDTESRAWGLPAATLIQLPAEVVRQIARMPSPEGGGESTLRLRSFASAESIAQLEETYFRLRLEATRDDLNPELYLLSGLFEMRELVRVEQIIAELQREHPRDLQVGFIVSLYRKAVRNAREAGEQQ